MQTMLLSAVILPVMAFLIFLARPRKSKPLKDWDFLDVLEYGDWKTVEEVRENVEMKTDLIIDPRHARMTLARLKNQGFVESRVRKRIVGTSISDMSEYKRVSQLYPREMGLTQIKVDGLPRGFGPIA